MKQTLTKNIILLKSFVEILKNPDRRVTVFIHDIIAMLVAVQLSFWLYYGDNLAYFSGNFIVKQMAIFGLLCAGFFLWFQTYRGVWRYVSITQILILAGAIGFASLLYLPLATKVSVQNIKIPRSLALMNWAIAVSLATTSRVFYRAFTGRWMAPENTDLSPKPTARLLIIGISRELEVFLTQLRQTSSLNYEILGIITDNQKLIGRYLQGYQILGTLSDLPDLIENFNAEGEHPHQLVIASPQFFGQKLQQLLKLVSDFRVDMYKLPNLSREPHHSLEVQPLILEDFFNFPQYKSLQEERGFFKEEKILILGASNLIGKQLVRLLLQSGVQKLILCDSNHLGLAEVKDELTGLEHDSTIQFVLTHLYDEKKYKYLLSHYKPTMVIYLDGIYEDEVAEANPLETLSENILTTKTIIDLAARLKINRFILVLQSHFSYETSVGQLSLKLAEAYCQSIDHGHETSRFIPIKLSPIVSSDSEFIFKMKQLFEHRLPIDLNCPNDPYALMTPATAAFSILRTIYTALNNRQIRGKSFCEVLSNQTMLTQFIELLARLENIPLDDVGDIAFLPPLLAKEGFDYQQKDLIRFEKNDYHLLGYNVPVGVLNASFTELQTSIDQFDNDKAMTTIRTLVSKINSR